MSRSLPPPTGMRSPRGTTGEAATMPGTSSIAAFMSSRVSGSGVTLAMRWPSLWYSASIWLVPIDWIWFNILLAGHADGYDQNQGGSTDHHPQRGQRETHLIAAESLVGEAQDFAVHHLRR